MTLCSEHGAIRKPECASCLAAAKRDEKSWHELFVVQADAEDLKKRVKKLEKDREL